MSVNNSDEDDGENIIIAAPKSQEKQQQPQSSASNPKQPIPDVGVNRNGVSPLQDMNLDMSDPQTLELIKRMKAASPLERREIYGKLQEKSILKGFPTMEELRKEDETSFHALDGKNPINMRAKKVKMIRDVGGSAIEVHFREYVDRAQNAIRIEKGFAQPEEIAKKVSQRETMKGQYEED